MPPRLSFAGLFGSVAVLSAVVLFAHARQSAVAMMSAWPVSAAVSLPIAIVAAAMGIVSRSGAVAGLIIASVLLAGSGWPAWLQLGAALAATAVATRAGRARNIAAGLAEDRHGRGWRNVAANTGLAACAALFAHDPIAGSIATLVATTVLITGAGDTVASEIGKAWGGPDAFYPMPLRRVPAGSAGAISAVGTCAGAGCAIAMCLFAEVTGLLRSTDVAAVAAAAILASLTEGFVSRGFESRGWLDNDSVNFVATAIGAGIALGLHALRP